VPTASVATAATVDGDVHVRAELAVKDAITSVPRPRIVEHRVVHQLRFVAAHGKVEVGLVPSKRLQRHMHMQNKYTVRENVT
jgi:hypothetical protein